MQYPFILKFSAVGNLSDARYAAGMWADLCGFCFNPTDPSYIEPSKAKEIAGWIKGPLLCGEFGKQPAEWIAEFIQNLSLNCIEIPSDYNHGTDFGPSGIKIILRVETAIETPLFPLADMFICTDKSVYDALQIFGKPVLLETAQLNTDASVLQGIALKGESEEKPGTRNHADWTEFLEKWALD